MYKNTGSTHEIKLSKLASKVGLGLGLCVAMHSAFACVQEEGTINPPTFIIVWGIIISFVFILAFLGWGVKKLLFPNANSFSLLFLADFLLAIALAAIGAFAVPQFEEVFVSFGVDLPIQTQLVFSARQALWLPSIFVIAFWRFTKRRSNNARSFALVLIIEAQILFLVLWAIYSPIFKMGSTCG